MICNLWGLAFFHIAQLIPLRFTDLLSSRTKGAGGAQKEVDAVIKTTRRTIVATEQSCAWAVMTDT